MIFDRVVDFRDGKGRHETRKSAGLESHIIKGDPTGKRIILRIIRRLQGAESNLNQLTIMHTVRRICIVDHG